MTTAIAQQLRRNQTDAERRLWQHLRNHHPGHNFRRQYPIAPYIVEFICLERRLIIELDGGQHLERQAAAAQGVASQRFFLSPPHSTLSPSGERETQYLSQSAPAKGGGIKKIRQQYLTKGESWGGG